MILVHCMTKHELSMPIKFKVRSLTVEIFANVVSKEMRLKL